MSIKWKLLLMVGLPVAAIVIIFGVGLSSFYVIDGNMDNVNMLHMDRATMIDADRDAYQAQVSVMNALTAKSAESLKKIKTESDENLQQTWDRISGPAENFTSDMKPAYDKFKTSYAAWKQNNDTVLALAAQTMEANSMRDQAEQAALASFDGMRNVINNLGELIDKELTDRTIGEERRMALESALSKVLNADRDAYQAYVAQLLIIKSTDAAEVSKLAESFTENVGQTKDRVTSGADIAGGQALALKSDFTEQFEAWNSQSQKVVDLTLSNIDKNLQKVARLDESDTNFSAMRGAINELGETAMKHVETELADLEDVINGTILIYILVTIAFVALSVIVTLIVASRIANVMKQSADVATSLSNGDFSVALNVKRNDEIGQLANAFTAMIDRLRDIVHQVQEATSTVASGSEELSSSSQALSQGATEQASAVEQVSSSMEEMAASISRNTESSVETERIARQTAHEAKEGGEAVRKTVESMSQIAEKISIIEEIARQTNLLALNAAIEAARAGEHGKGFAVVAAEVRKLAEKSGQAASEISELSSESVEVATQAGKMLDSIVPNIERTAELVQEISAASSEQDQGASEVNSALQQLDSVVQANAGSSEEIASTAEELSAQAMHLEQTMAFFRLSATAAPRSQKTIVRKATKAIAPPPKSRGLALDMGEDDSFERF